MIMSMTTKYFYLVVLSSTMELREPLPPHTPLKRSTDQPGTVEPFDMIAALRGVCVKVWLKLHVMGFDVLIVNIVASQMISLLHMYRCWCSPHHRTDSMLSRL